MAQRPKSRAIEATRAHKARQPAGRSGKEPAVPAATDTGKPAETAPSPQTETPASERRPSRSRAVKPKLQPADPPEPAAVGAPPKRPKTGKAAASKQTGKEAGAERIGKNGPRAKPSRKARRSPPYLAAELGQPVDHEGEPIGASSPMARSDTELQEYTLQLWQQMQSRRGVNQHIRAMEHAGLTVDDLWATGVAGKVSTSSTPDELRRYRQNLLFRANLLEAILMDTVSELRRLETVEPTPPSAGGSS